MKTKNTLKTKEAFVYLLFSAFTILSFTPIEAQVKRDNRAEKKEIKVRDHRVTNKTITKSKTLNFDEADAIFGTRTELQTKYPGLKFTGKIDQIKITKKLPDGENYIHKTTSGNAIYASVKKGKITGLSLRNPKMRDVKDGTSNTVIYSDNNSTCFKCTKICHDPDGAGVDTCWTTCVVVDCSKDHNAKIPGKIVSTIKSNPSPAGPIPIPYPNISKLDTIKKNKKVKKVKF